MNLWFLFFWLFLSPANGQADRQVGMALIERAQNAYETGDYLSAARDFEQYYRDHSDAEFASLALMNAAIGYEQVPDMDRAMSLYEEFANRFETDANAPHILMRLGTKYLQWLELEKAKKNLIRLVEQHPKDELSRDLMFDLASLHLAMDEYDDAARYYLEVAKTPGDGADQALYQAARAYRAGGNTSKALETFDEFVRRYRDENPLRSIMVLDEQIQIQLDLNDKRSAGETRKALLHVFRQVPRDELPSSAIEAAARAALVDLLAELAEYEAIQLPKTLKTKKVSPILNKKSTMALDLTDRADEFLMEFPSSEALAASVFIQGRVLQGQAEMIQDWSPSFPKSFGPEEQDAFADKKDDLVEPFVDGALQRYQSLYERGWSGQRNSIWADKVRDELHSLSPGEFPKFRAFKLMFGLFPHEPVCGELCESVDLDCRVALARCAAAEGQDIAAAMRSVVKLDPFHGDAYAWLADQYLREGKLEMAFFVAQNGQWSAMDGGKPSPALACEYALILRERGRAFDAYGA
ncbi:MAG: tetratricopeptide repeat protein, partial [Proteobacteria bacterium]|nr:tetratricopeptide repeat protein [Pseudomonadota bacterium]